MNKRETIISGRECILFDNASADCLLVQPVDDHDSELLEQEVKQIQALSDKPFSLVAFRVGDWNKELTPWPAPPVFGKVPFGEGAEKTLAFVVGQLLPEFHGEIRHCLLGGYSLAGLFALWAAYQTDLFAGVVAASPSVWYPGWTEYVADKTPMAKSIYLSLGDKEEKTKNPVMAQVGNAIRMQYDRLAGQMENVVLEWNQGNHFVDADKRMAKGFTWLMNGGKK